MEAIMLPVIVMGITGVVMGLFLAFASKKFEVEVDPKVEQIMAILPGVNCGGCGYPGCTGYAMGVVNDGISMTLCAPGGPKVAQGIGDIMGVAVEMPVKKKKEAKKKVVKKPVVAATGTGISASQEFIEKNKKSLNKYKEAFDEKDEEKMTKMEGLAKKVKKEELLKYYSEIKEGKLVPDPATMGAGAVVMISAPKEFVEKNKKSLNKYKEAFDEKDEEKMTKMEELAKKVKKEELLKYYSEIKEGKLVPDPETMPAEQKVEAKATEEKEEVKEEVKTKESEAANYCSILGDGLCVPEENKKIMEGQEEIKKAEAAALAEKNMTPEEKEKKEEAANYCNILGDGLCVPEQNEKILNTMEKEMK